MALRVSVTTLEGFRLYLEEDWKPEEELLAELRGQFQATPKMLLGKSGHCAMEGQNPKHDDSVGDHRCLGFKWTRDAIEGCRRAFRSGGVAEVKAERVFRIGGEDVTLVGKADRLIGTEVVEHKFTLSPFDPDRYSRSYQWRGYSLLFQPSAVLYTVFCVDEGRGESAALELKDVHPIDFYPYSQCEADVRDLLGRFVEYVDLRGLREYLQPYRRTA